MRKFGWYWPLMREWGEGEDPRYTKLGTWVDGDRAFAWLSLRQVFLLQGSAAHCFTKKYTIWVPLPHSSHTSTQNSRKDDLHQG